MAPNAENECPVCGDNTSNHSVKKYGPKVCRSCGLFFLHNSSVEFSCKQEKCVITKGTREKCRFCRLKKCVDVGMRVPSSSQQQQQPPPREERAQPLAEDSNQLAGNTSDSSNATARKAKIDDRTAANSLKDAENEAPKVKKSKIDDKSTPTNPSAVIFKAPSTSNAPVQVNGQASRVQMAPDDPNMEILAAALPPKGHFAITAANHNKKRSTRFSFSLSLIEESHKRWAMEMLETRHGYSHLPAQFKVKLSRESLMLTHIIDAAWAIANNETENEYVLKDGKTVPTDKLVIFGNPETYNGWKTILDHLKKYGFDKRDYCLYRQLALVDSFLLTRDSEYRAAHLAFLRAWQDSRRQLVLPQIDRIMSIFRDFVVLALYTQNYLINKYVTGQAIVPSKFRIMHSIVTHRRAPVRVEEQDNDSDQYEELA